MCPHAAEASATQQLHGAVRHARQRLDQWLRAWFEKKKLLQQCCAAAFRHRAAGLTRDWTGFKVYDGVETAERCGTPGISGGCSTTNSDSDSTRRGHDEDGPAVSPSIVISTAPSAAPPSSPRRRGGHGQLITGRRRIVAEDEACVAAFEAWLRGMQHPPEPTALMMHGGPAWPGLDAAVLERLQWRVRAIRARVRLSDTARPLPLRPALRLAIRELGAAGKGNPAAAVPDLVDWLSETADGPQCLLITPDVRDAVTDMYREFVPAFRSRFAMLCNHGTGLPGVSLPSHWYALYKLLQLLGRDVDILRDKGLCMSGPVVERYDRLWKAVCAELDWPYLPSIAADVSETRADVLAPYELIEPYRCGSCCADAAADRVPAVRPLRRWGWRRYHRITCRSHGGVDLGGGWHVQYVYVRAEGGGCSGYTRVDAMAQAALPKLRHAIEYERALDRLVLWAQGCPGSPHRVGDAWSVDDAVTFHVLQHRGALHLCATVHLG